MSAFPAHIRSLVAKSSPVSEAALAMPGEYLAINAVLDALWSKLPVERKAVAILAGMDDSK